MAFIEDLTVAAAAGKLAQAMREAEIDAFGRVGKGWRALSFSERAVYVDAAVLFLESRRRAVLPFRNQASSEHSFNQTA